MRDMLQEWTQYILKANTPYPMKNPDQGRAEVSQDNARDIVEAIDQLICRRMVMSKYWTTKSQDEEVELLKRKITDYLLVTDPRAGVFRKPE